MVFLSNIITTKEKERERAANQKINKEKLKNLLTEYVEIYDRLKQEEKSRFNQLIFIEITSFFNQNEEDEQIIIKIRGDGKLKSNWPKTINPEELSSQLRGHWLRDQDSNLQPFV